MDGSTNGASVGVVLVRPERRLGAEPFMQEWFAGTERVLLAAGVTTLVYLAATHAEELEVHRRWMAERTVDGIFLTDLARNDPRLEILHRSGLAVVVIGDPTLAGGYPALWTDDARAMRSAVEILHALGHRAIGRVGGPVGLAHSQIRTEAFVSACRDAGIAPATASAGYDEKEGRRATEQLLDDATPPTAIIFDDDLMALGALAALAERSLEVPGDVSLLAWDDSTLCQLSSPRLSVMGHDIQTIGELAGAMMLDTLQGRPVGDRKAPTPLYVERESVGPR